MVKFTSDIEDSGTASFSKEYGEDGETVLYREDGSGNLVRINTVPRDLFIEERINEVNTLEAELFAPQDVRDNLAERDILYVFPSKGSKPIKFRITDVEFTSEYKMKIKADGVEVKLSDGQTERTVYENTDGDQIVTSEVPTTQIPHETIESAPAVTIRGDYDNDLKFVSAVASAVGYDFFLSQKEADDYTVDYLNFVEERGSDTTVATLDPSDNVSIVERKNDSEVLVNKIVGLGYGDGDNQLKVEMWDAGPQTLLTNKLPEGDTSTLSVKDASIFGSNGDNIEVRVGSENISGTISDSTTINIDGSGRGLNDYNGDTTEDMDHLVGTAVWLVENTTTGDGPYTPDNPDSDTSIDTNDIVEDDYTNRNIIDRPTLERVTWRQLRNRREAPIRMKVELSDVETDIQMGDQVEVSDDTAKTDNTFDVVGFDRQLGSGVRWTRLVVSNLPRSLVEEIREIKDSQESTDRHMQGATNIDSQNFGDNGNNSKPIKTKVRVPDDAVAINKFEVGFTRESFRGYVQNQPHQHDVDVTHPQHDHLVDISENVNPVRQSYAQGETVDTSTNTINIFATVPSAVGGTFRGVQTTLQFRNNTGSQQTYDFNVYDSNSNQINSGSLTVDDNSAVYVTETYSSSTVDEGETLELEVTNGVLGTESSSPIHGGIVIYLTSSSTRTSSQDLGTTEAITSKEGGAPNYGIYEPSSESDVSVDVNVDGNTVTTINNVSVGDEVAQVDAKSELDEPIAGNYHNIELVPSGQCRLNAVVFTKVFVESTV